MREVNSLDDDSSKGSLDKYESVSACLTNNATCIVTFHETIQSQQTYLRPRKILQDGLTTSIDSNVRVVRLCVVRDASDAEKQSKITFTVLKQMFLKGGTSLTAKLCGHLPGGTVRKERWKDGSHTHTAPDLQKRRGEQRSAQRGKDGIFHSRSRFIWE